MGKIISAYIFPHPPIIVPEVGRGNEKEAQKTIDAMRIAAKEIKKDNPDTIIVITPHGPVMRDYVYVSRSEFLEGDLKKFHAPNVRMKFKNNLSLAGKVLQKADENDIEWQDHTGRILRRYGYSGELDHGAIVPLYFVNEELTGFKIIHMAFAWMPFLKLYKFGTLIGEAVRESGERVVILASGDLSHRLSHDTAYGYSRDGKIFDDLLVKSVSDSDVERLLELDEDFCESAGECGLRSILIMYGTLDGMSLKPEVYSYEGPYGIGYAVARIEVGEEDGSRKILNIVEKKNAERINRIRNNESPHVRLARQSLESYVREGRTLKLYGEFPEEMLQKRAGVFVSIKKNGHLRGCIGTIVPTRKNIAEEIIYNAISAGTQDPRFEPVSGSELDSLVYSVDVLSDPEPISSMEELDVKRFGVIVRKGYRSGLLLPDLEGVDTPAQQVSIALQKAGINPDEDFTMERFEVKRYK